MFSNQRDDATVIDSPGAEGIDTDRCGFGNSDRVRNLYFATFSNARGDNILGHVTCGVSCRAVNLGRVLAREGAAAVTRHTTIGVNDNFTARQSGVTHRPANHEPAGWIDVDIFVFTLGKPVFRQYRFEDGFYNRLAQSVEAYLFFVLGRQNYRFNTDGFVILVTQRDLALCVGQ